MGRSGFLGSRLGFRADFRSRGFLAGFGASRLIAGSLVAGRGGSSFGRCVAITYDPDEKDRAVAHEFARLFSAAPDLLRELKAVEWGGRADNALAWRCCPSCGGADPSYGAALSGQKGHHDGCALAAALAKADARK